MAAPGWQEPPPGSAISDLDRSAYRCTSTAAVVRCRPNRLPVAAIGDIPALSQTLLYRDGRLERISTAVDTAHFDRLRQQLTEQFGAGEQTTERLRAGMGGVFPNVLVAWRLADRCVLLEQHFERVTQSGVSVMDPGAFDALVEQRERLRVRGLRDF